MKDLLEKIDITPEMRDAGAVIIRAGGWGPEDLAVLTYRAMRVLERRSAPRGSKTVNGWAEAARDEPDRVCPDAEVRKPEKIVDSITDAEPDPEMISPEKIIEQGRQAGRLER